MTIRRLLGATALLIAAACAVEAQAAQTGSDARTGASAVQRGRYLVQVGGCNDCHTPGHFLGKEDTTRTLGGSDVGLEVPGLGTFVPPNLTPDKATGLGAWTSAQIVTALTRGVRPDGRVLAPIMPWQAYSSLTRSDAAAIAAYLQSLTPVNHKVPGPFRAGEKAPLYVMKLIPPGLGAANIEHEY